MIKLYSTPTCPYCKMAKEYLKKKGVKFIDFNVSSDEKARKELFEKSKQLGVPVIDFNGEIIIGFDKEAIDNVLKRK
ncbi:MAG: glutathione S-transferase N-terminal domain-containing protein [Nanoarchaeota archaeon]|nr:glutathione S-transferase N-terminal domain-containing protein [Nanoarchaeota archaeon]